MGVDGAGVSADFCWSLGRFLTLALAFGDLVMTEAFVLGVLFGSSLSICLLVS
jgi:hypothetical protein